MSLTAQPLQHLQTSSSPETSGQPGVIWPLATISTVLPHTNRLSVPQTDKHIPAPGPLHLLCPLPGVFTPLPPTPIIPGLIPSHFYISA